MIDEKTKEWLKQLHEQEDDLNKEMAEINCRISQLRERKAQISKRISNNMKCRNRLLFPERANFIEDGEGGRWSIFCPSCKKPKMQVVRPGEIRCSRCG